MKSEPGWLAGLLVLFVFLMGCIGLTPATLTPDATASFTSTVTDAPSQTATAAPTFTPSPTATITSTPEPFGCLKPSEDYTRLSVNNQTLNARTLGMLAQAQTLYGGEIELTGHAVTQGSYTDSLATSFGTHAGGGAVDLSVLRRGTYTVLWDDIPPLLRVLRAAGFAAWLREYGELHANSPIHIHAIAIGDAELSPAAQAQLTGEAGYFRGFNGLPIPAGGMPIPDRYGGPIVCQWMIELGYGDLR